VLEDLLKDGSPIITNATITQKGALTNHYAYLKNYAGL